MIMLKIVLGFLTVTVAAGLSAQVSTTEAVEVWCPSVLGVGIKTEVPFCDVEVQRDPSFGVLVILPPHRGDATLSFSLHNRHTYSEQEVRDGQAYAQYVASIAVATMEGQIVAKGVVLGEFRAVGDLFDRMGGGAGPDGIKAIAPMGSERVVVTIPEDLEEVAIVGQSLDVVRPQSHETFESVGRPVAVVSNATVTYNPR